MSLQRYFNPGILIERSTQESNGMGGYVDTWTTHLDVSGLIDGINGKETKIAAKYREHTTHILMCAAGYDITTDDRVKDQGKIYRILFVDEPFKKHAEILLEYVGVDNE